MSRRCGWMVMLMVATAMPVAADEELPKLLTGAAVLEHPAGKAVIAAAELLAAGKFAEVRMASVADVRAEWQALSPAEQLEEAARNRERAPDPATFAAQIEAVGELTIYGDSAQLRIPTADGDIAAMAFVALEGGVWKVTAGPMTIAPPPEETAPEVLGAEIFDHEIGKLALAFAAELHTKGMAAALALMSSAAKAAWAAQDGERRRESDRIRRETIPTAEVLAARVREGGRLGFYGDKAYLIVNSSERTENPDGSVTYSSTSLSLPFELEEGEWRVGE